MKWLVFTVLVVGALVALGVLAVDERDVVWEAGQPHCPYCRADVEHLALVCRNCRKSFDWQSHRATCRWCLERNDVDYLKDLFTTLRVEQDPLPGRLEAFPVAYFKAIDEGACTFCGGLGAVLEGGAEVECRVCRGSKRCTGCGGDREVVVGDAEAHRRALELDELTSRAEARARLTGLPVKRALIEREAVERLRGFREAESLADAHQRGLLEQARARLKLAFRALTEEASIARSGRPTVSGS